MQSAKIRSRFLAFFQARGHAIIPSDSLIPSGDPTVLFTSAGMNQFKDCFLGKRTDLTRAASCQKCLRTGDLDNVGRTPSHHSFFEMLGNFSFGDYFKPEAIQWAWEFLTGTLDYAGTRRSDVPQHCLSLPAATLWVSIYEEDAEAERLWRALGMPAERIRRFGQADNFWPANAPAQGPNGPCGPCSEIYYDAEGRVQGPQSVEVWNLVFTQFDRQPDGRLQPLPKPNIDTGMGLERLTRVLQAVPTDYETDQFAPIVRAIQALPRGPQAKADRREFAVRAIADHLRAMVFLLAEGLLPSNESRGYILRMLIRRAHRLGRSALDLRGGTFLAGLAGAVEEAMRGLPYSGLLAAKREVIRRGIEQEEAQFLETLEAGTARLDELMRGLGSARTITGLDAFTLYDTYGFPLELTIDIAGERGFAVERAGFDQALETQRARSRAASAFSGGVFAGKALEVRRAVPGLPPKDEQFVGYEAPQADTVLKGIWNGTAWVPSATASQSVGLVLERSPFYGEAGGQIGDAGRIEGAKGWAEVTQTVWVDETLLHQATVREGSLRVQDPVRARVDPERRLQVARSHTAAHLLHWALRTVIGPDAVQAGSFVEAERVRFDFSSLHGLREEQREQVERLVNQRVRLIDPVRTGVLPLEQARQAGALALFGEKYGSNVRVVTIGDYSKELCGGTHVAHTGFVGPFLITGESSIASGTRRIEALVGEAAAERQRRHERILQEAARRLSRPAQDVVAGLEDLLQQLKRAEQERKALRAEAARVEAQRLVAQAKQIGGVTVITSVIKQADRELLATMADAVRRALPGGGIVLLGSAVASDQAALVMATTNGLAQRVHAGQLLKAVAPLVQGSGGGRPEFAQAGGKHPAGLPAAMQKAEALIREALERGA